MAKKRKSEDKYGDAMEPRVDALDSIFGKQSAYVVSPVPFYLGGNPTIIAYEQYLPGHTVYSTSEMTGGWGSGQKAGALGEYELVMVLPKGSPLSPELNAGSRVRLGWAGETLAAFARYSCDAELNHGDTSGPLPDAFTPHAQFFFAELAGGRVKFEFGGRRYGLLLIMSITEAEFRFQQQEGSAALLKRLRGARAFPATDPARASVC